MLRNHIKHAQFLPNLLLRMTHPHLLLTIVLLNLFSSFSTLPLSTSNSMILEQNFTVVVVIAGADETPLVGGPAEYPKGGTSVLVVIARDDRNTYLGLS